IFASKFPAAGLCLHTFINRFEYAVNGEQIAIEHTEGTRYFDIWNGRELTPAIRNGQAFLSFDMEARGFGAVLSVAAGTRVDGLDDFIALTAQANAKPLSAYSGTWKALAQTQVAIPATAATTTAPQGMVSVPAGEFVFAVSGVE